MSADARPIRRAAVLGDPVDHSLSPLMHRYWLERAGLRGDYVALPVSAADFAEAVRVLPKLGFAGVNVTLPHKERAAAIADRLDPLAKRLGAANMLTFHPGGEIEGRNLDVEGFRKSLALTAAAVENGPGVALVLGAGGAARAVVAALAEDGWARIHVLNRTEAKAHALVEDLAFPVVRAGAWESCDALLREADVVVNATSLGMTGRPPLALSLEHAKPSAVVCDIVYTPLETPLLSEAAARGLQTRDGLGMLIHQGAPAFQAWFGADAAIDEGLRARLLSALGRAA